jgi:tRNA1Val (adenine37-N6)-methyltransferase
MADALFRGKLVLHQPARTHGYRVNVDALLLASFARGRRPAATAVDLGAGVGGVGLALLFHGAAARVLFVEKDARAASMARQNLDANGWCERGEVVTADVRAAARAAPGTAALVVCNPPYVEPGRGRAAAEPRREARQGSLADFVAAARAFVARRARACFVYPAADLVTLVETLRKAGLEPKRMRAVHATAEAPARVVLVEALAAKRGGLLWLPAFVERAGGAPSPELERLVRGEDVS